MDAQEKRRARLQRWKASHVSLESQDGQGSSLVRNVDSGARSSKGKFAASFSLNRPPSLCAFRDKRIKLRSSSPRAKHIYDFVTPGDFTIDGGPASYGEDEKGASSGTEEDAANQDKMWRERGGDHLDGFFEKLDNADNYDFSALAAVNEDSYDASKPEKGVVSTDSIIADLKRKATKYVPAVDHASIQYPPFKKTFYTETSTDVLDDDSIRRAMGIELKNAKIGPLTDWSGAGFPEPIMSVLREKSYQNLTPIQAQALPVVMSGRDLIGVAQTGSGKTMAFVLPLIRHVQDQTHKPDEGPIAMVLAPTRELCSQIANEMVPFLDVLNLRVVTAYGGAPIKDQIADLKRGAHVIVCTPGRMIDLLVANSGRVLSLKRATFVVIDEADRMFDMGFEPQIRRIIQNVRPDRQTVVFSATLSPQMEKLARNILTNPAEILVGTRSTVSPLVSQSVLVLEPAEKFPRLLSLLQQFYIDQPESQSIVFVETQNQADEIASQLISQGYRSTSLHGAKPQFDRDSAIEEFKRNQIQLLVATSLAARGLDVKNIRLVVNYEPPSHLEDYVHRVGRTGRAGIAGTAITMLTTGQSRQAYDVLRALRAGGAKVPEALERLAAEFESQKGRSSRHVPGFGGKGLSRLDSDRKAKRAQEFEALGGGAAGARSTVELTGPETRSSDLLATRSTSAGHPQITQITSSNKTGVSPTILFQCILEINDLPQPARVAVTTFSQQSKVSEAHSVSITNKGRFFTAASREEGERLNLLIEGRTEQAVRDAYASLIELISSAASQSTKQKARYSI